MRISIATGKAKKNADGKPMTAQDYAASYGGIGQMTKAPGSPAPTARSAVAAAAKAKAKKKGP